jgi:hypothetical protein
MTGCQKQRQPPTFPNAKAQASNMQRHSSIKLESLISTCSQQITAELLGLSLKFMWVPKTEASVFCLLKHVHDNETNASDS